MTPGKHGAETQQRHRVEPRTGREEELGLKACCHANIPRAQGQSRSSPQAGSVTGVPQLEGGSEEGPGGESQAKTEASRCCMFSLECGIQNMPEPAGKVDQVPRMCTTRLRKNTTAKMGSRGSDPSPQREAV